jgi:uncharacterized protein YifE (UPF0438 family)
MADGLFNLLGRRTEELTKDGKTYRLAFRTLGDYASKEEAMLLRMGNPFAGIAQIEDQKIRQELTKTAVDIATRPLIATMQDEERFDNSMRGIAWSIWRALSVNHSDEFPPTLPAERGIQLGLDFIEWFSDIRKILKALHKIEEKDILGNSGAQAATA